MLKTALLAAMFAVGVAFFVASPAFAFGDVVGQKQQQQQEQEVEVNQKVTQDNSQETTFESGRYGHAPGIALGGYGFGGAVQDCYAMGRGKVGSIGGSVGVASNGVNGGGGLFSYGTSYSLAFLDCVNDNRIVMAVGIGDTNAAHTFKCMSPAWRIAEEATKPGSCAGIPTITKMAIDPEEDSFASALSDEGSSMTVSTQTITTRVREVTFISDDRNDS